MNMTATQMYKRDARFRSQVSAAVARAVDEAREYIDPDNLTLRDVHEVATSAAMNILKMTLEGDAELFATRMERDHWKEVAERAVMSSPLSMVIPIATTEPKVD